MGFFPRAEVPATVDSMRKTVTWRARHPRWRLAEGIVKGALTTPRKETTVVFVKPDGEIVLRPVEADQRPSAAPSA